MESDPYFLCANCKKEITGQCLCINRKFYCDACSKSFTTCAHCQSTAMKDNKCHQCDYKRHKCIKCGLVADEMIVRRGNIKLCNNCAYPSMLPSVPSIDQCNIS